MNLVLHRFADIDDFENAALPFLLDREPEHNLFIAICGQIRAGRYGDYYLAAVERNGEVVGAAFRTPPFNLTLSYIADPGAVELIASDAHGVYGSLPGAAGPKDDARAFAGAWEALSGQRGTVSMRQRIYEATRASNPARVPGEMRDATLEERELMISWFDAFNEEVGGITGDAAENVDLRLRGGTSGLVVWWDGRPVSLAGFGGPTPNGIRIGPVFTPPELRGLGYATACVAAATQRLLDEGRRLVFLYTDLANPTSNSIYQRIGYRPIRDVDVYAFD